MNGAANITGAGAGVGNLTPTFPRVNFNVSEQPPTGNARKACDLPDRRSVVDRPPLGRYLAAQLVASSTISALKESTRARRNAPRVVMRLDVALTARLLLGGLLLWSGASKLLRIELFRTTVAALGWVWPMLLAVMLCVWELLAGAAFLVGTAPGAATIAGIGLVIAFAVASVRGLGRQVPCRCFGGPSAMLGRSTMVRAGLVTLPLVAYAYASAGGDPSPWPRDLTTVELCATVAVGLVVAGAWLLALVDVRTSVGSTGET